MFHCFDRPVSHNLKILDGRKALQNQLMHWSVVRLLLVNQLAIRAVFGVSESDEYRKNIFFGGAEATLATQLAH